MRQKVATSGNVTSTRIVLPDSDEEEIADRWVKSTARHVTIDANTSSKSRLAKKTRFSQAEELEAIPAPHPDRTEDAPVTEDSILFDHGAWSEAYGVGDIDLSCNHEYGDDRPDDEDEGEGEDEEEELQHLRNWTRTNGRMNGSKQIPFKTFFLLLPPSSQDYIVLPSFSFL